MTREGPTLPLSTAFSPLTAPFGIQSSCLTSALNPHFRIFASRISRFKIMEPHAPHRKTNTVIGQLACTRSRSYLRSAPPAVASPALGGLWHCHLSPLLFTLSFSSSRSPATHMPAVVMSNPFPAPFQACSISSLGITTTQGHVLFLFFSFFRTFPFVHVVAFPLRIKH